MTSKGNIDMAANGLNKGSEWHRWDPHIHTPATLLSNQFDGWDRYLDAIEAASPTVEALGITEYCLLDGYRAFRAYQDQGRAGNVRLAFPNLEFRLTIETEKKGGINLHLLFSPDDPKHEDHIERIVGQFTYEWGARTWHCNEKDLRALGYAFNKKQSDPRKALEDGVNQFKVNPVQLRDILRKEGWLRENCLVAVATGSDGTSSLKSDDSFASTRVELEALADIMFSGREGDRAFWLGKGKSSPEEIERGYRSLKPCLHGSDAHRMERVLKPDLDRYCWIRSELTFAGLKQTLHEPEHRVWIGPHVPTTPQADACLARVDVTGAGWLATPSIELNSGLVAIIGPKGSGKTALADIIAHAAGAAISDEESFLHKAQPGLDGASAEVTWLDNVASGAQPLDVLSAADDRSSSVRYLSQQFVNRLCKAEAMSEELLGEIESVVFQAIPEEDRFGMTTFGELRAWHIQQIEDARADATERVDLLSLTVATEDAKKGALVGLQKKRQEDADALTKAVAAVRSLVPKEKKQEAANLEAVAAAIVARTKQVQEAKASRGVATKLREAVTSHRLTWQRDFEAMRSAYPQAGLNDEEWDVLAPQVHPGANTLLDALQAKADARVKAALEDGRSGPDATYDKWSLEELRAEQKKLETVLGVEKERALKRSTQQTAVATLRQSITNADAKIADALGADARKRKASDERRQTYAGIFDLVAKEQKVLEDLYQPLAAQLSNGTSAQAKLEFYVWRDVDLESWVERGEALLDLRRTGSFSGRGKLSEIATRVLLNAWQNGDATAIAVAMDKFMADYGQHLAAAQLQSTTRQEMGAWLYATNHVSLRYGIKYDGVDLSKLSPGMRGIVLLMLYLAIDLWDLRPLIVDQPEENLDPQSVYDELVGYFRLAKQRRQVVLVTHNPNLVVNADADQIIVAESVREGPGLPRIAYTSGGLEDAEIRGAVCRVLEGGERAFRERERRYGLPRDYRVVAS